MLPYEPAFTQPICSDLYNQFSYCSITLIFYLASAQKTLHSVSPQNRIMKPGIVWLVLVPFFGYFWLFKVTDALTINTNIDLSGYGLSQKDTMQTTGLDWVFFMIAGLFFAPLYIISYVAFVWHRIKVNEAGKLILLLKEIVNQTDDSSTFK